MSVRESKIVRAKNTDTDKDKDTEKHRHRQRHRQQTQTQSQRLQHINVLTCIPADIFLVTVGLLVLELLDQLIRHLVVGGGHLSFYLPTHPQAKLPQPLVLLVLVVHQKCTARGRTSSVGPCALAGGCSAFCVRIRTFVPGNQVN